MEFDQTQAISYENDSNIDSDDEEEKIVAYLEVPLQKGFAGKRFPLYKGSNIIGRSAEGIQVHIPIQSLSKEHCCIDCGGDTCLVYDMGSKNKTRMGKMFLTPHIRYQLLENNQLLLGDVTCTFIKSHDQVMQLDDGDDSDTGSESMLVEACRQPQGPRAASEEETPSVGNEENFSSDLLQPTQAYAPDGSGPLLRKAETPLVEDSCNEDTESFTVKPSQVMRESVAETPRTGDNNQTVDETQIFESCTQSPAVNAVQNPKLSLAEESDTDDELFESAIYGAATQAYVPESDGEDDSTQTYDVVNESEQVADSDVEKSDPVQRFDPLMESTQIYQVADEGKPVDEDATQLYEPMEEETGIYDVVTQRPPGVGSSTHVYEAAEENDCVDGDSGNPSRDAQEETQAIDRDIYCEATQRYEPSHNEVKPDSDVCNEVTQPHMTDASANQDVDEEPKDSTFDMVASTLPITIQATADTSTNQGTTIEQEASTLDMNCATLPVSPQVTPEKPRHPEGSLFRIRCQQSGSLGAEESPFKRPHTPPMGTPDMAKAGHMFTPEKDSQSPKTSLKGALKTLNLLEESSSEEDNSQKETLLITPEVTPDKPTTHPLGSLKKVHFSDDQADASPLPRSQDIDSTDDCGDLTQAYDVPDAPADIDEENTVEPSFTQAYTLEAHESCSPEETLNTQAFSGGGEIDATQSYDVDMSDCKVTESYSDTSASTSSYVTVDQLTCLNNGEERVENSQSSDEGGSDNKCANILCVPFSTANNEKSDLDRTQEAKADNSDDISPVVPPMCGTRSLQVATDYGEELVVEPSAPYGESQPEKAADTKSGRRVSRRTVEVKSAEERTETKRSRRGCRSKCESSTVEGVTESINVDHKQSVTLPDVEGRKSAGSVAKGKITSVDANSAVGDGETRRSRQSCKMSHESSTVDSISEKTVDEDVGVDQNNSETSSVPKGRRGRKCSANAAEVNATSVESGSAVKERDPKRSCQSRATSRESCSVENVTEKNDSRVDPEELETLPLQKGRRGTKCAGAQVNTTQKVRGQSKSRMSQTSEEIADNHSNQRRGKRGKVHWDEEVKDDDNGEGSNVAEEAEEKVQDINKEKRQTDCKRTEDEEESSTTRRTRRTRNESKEKVTSQVNGGESSEKTTRGRSRSKRKQEGEKMKDDDVDTVEQVPCNGSEVEDTSKAGTRSKMVRKVKGEDDDSMSDSVETKARSKRKRRAVNEGKADTLIEPEPSQPGVKKSRRVGMQANDAYGVLEKGRQQRCKGDSVALGVGRGCETVQAESELNVSVASSSCFDAEDGPSTRRGRKRKGDGSAAVDKLSADIGDKSQSVVSVPSSTARKSRIQCRQSMESSRSTNVSTATESGATEPEAKSRGRSKNRKLQTCIGADKEKSPVKGTRQVQKGKTVEAASEGATPAKMRWERSSSTDSQASPGRSCRKISKPRIIFTGVSEDSFTKIIQDLGGEIAKSPTQATHLVTDEVRRTVKFMCCIAKGIPVVNPEWLKGCRDAHTFIDTHSFTLKDAKYEKEYKTSLTHTLDKSSEAPLFTGYRIHVTKSVKPPPKEMKDIITCAGGQYLSSLPNKFADRTVVVTCEEDLTQCQPALSAGIPCTSKEFIMTGLLRHQLDVEGYSLKDRFVNTAHKRRR